MTLYVNETGTPGAPTIIFLHGVGTSGWMWWKQTPALNDFHCLNVDLPGHGRSSHLPWVSFADTAHQVAAIIQSRALNARAYLVGLSLGGYIALTLLQRHANSVDRVVVSGVTAAPMEGRNMVNPQIWLMTSVMQQPWVANLQAKLLGLPQEIQTAFVENLRLMSKATYRTIIEEAAEFVAPPALSQINNPTLVLAGSRESKGILEAVKTLPKLLPNAQGCIAPGVSHGWNVQAPDLFNRTVRAWVTNTPLPSELKIV